MRKIAVCLTLANLAALIWFSGLSEADSNVRSDEYMMPAQTETEAPQGSIGRSTLNAKERAATRGRRNQGGNQSRTTFELPDRKKAAEGERQTEKRGKPSTGSSEMPSAQLGGQPSQIQRSSRANEMKRPAAAGIKGGRARNSQGTVIGLPEKREQTTRGRLSAKKTRIPAASSTAGSPASDPKIVDGRAVAPAGTVKGAGRSVKNSRRIDGNKTGAATRNQRGSKSVATQAAVSQLPAPSGPLPSLTAEQEMVRAYQAFDLAYAGSLGKTRKELNELWGFPMKKLGDNGDETAYGFRQKGLLDMPQAAFSGRDSSDDGAAAPAYYAPKSFDPSLPGKYFACVVVLWVDKKGRGVVVDGNAMGDCFMVESLSRRPEVFER